ncbi:MAG: anhydro-N-acetylmuramic acid kinase [Elusimicrobia bacterium]|nr:anhydro-N-acetylmuramic acid kinase [Elusimicrobiota bacterium]
MSRLALGLMSGTSADGVSLALARVGERRLRVLAHATEPYPAALRRRILGAIGLRAPELSWLHFELGRVFAAAASRFLRAERVAPSRLFAVGSHGQTVVHLPDEPRPSTLQLGEPSFLAEALGVPVVADFRPRDMAAGGQGAPLAPFLDEHLFGGGPPRALQNIGGIGNVTLAGRGVRTLGFDTGPGNCLIDLAVGRITGGRQAFDRDGRIARRGRPDEALARALLRAPYFRRRPPKSLDRSSFGEEFLRASLGAMLRRRPEDAVATLTLLTALSIADAYRRFLPVGRLREAVVSGGGALNPALMEALARALAPLPVVSIERRGIPPVAKEPALIALLAALAVAGRTNHCPAATGARGPRILGKILPQP